MSLGGSQVSPGGWSWPDELDSVREHQTNSEPNHSNEQSHTNSQSPNPSQPQNGQNRQRYYKPRTCRICLETVLPTYHPPSENLPGFMQGTPSVTYESPDNGRLLRPCKCKGTSKYVHEGCLQAWRHADPGYSRRNYWQCPTCGYRYRLQRLGFGRIVSSVAAQIVLTIMILLTTVFLLGFISDPILNFFLDPYGSLYGYTWEWGYHSRPVYYEFYEEERRPLTWMEHMTKGFAWLGMLSFFKVIFTSPWQFLYRNIWGGRRAGTTGRNRLNDTTWLLVLVGAVTFLYVSPRGLSSVIKFLVRISRVADISQTVWKGVRSWSKRTLEKAGEKVMDVQGDDNDDDDDGNDEAPT